MQKTVFKQYWDETLIELKEHNFIQKIIHKSWFNNLKYCTSTESSIIIVCPPEIPIDPIVSRYGVLLEYIMYKKSGQRLRVEIEVLDDSIGFDHNLKEEYSFDNFFTGKNNEFAMNVAKVITMNPGKEFNPCFIHGGAGTGKTHFLQAIGNEIKKSKPELKVLYTPSESFLCEFIVAIRKGDVNNFKKKYRNIDVLLMDDIHNLERKSATQQEMIYTFKELLRLNKQIVITCDRLTTSLVFLSEGLKSTITNEIELEILPPEYNERVAIIKKMGTDKGIKIPEVVSLVIARGIKDDVNKLKSAIIKMFAYKDLTGKEITKEVIERNCFD